MRLVHINTERTIIQLLDGTMLFVGETGLIMKRIPGRKRSETKEYDYRDMIIINDALRAIYPNLREISEPNGVIYTPFITDIEVFPDMTQIEVHDKMNRRMAKP